MIGGSGTNGGINGNIFSFLGHFLAQIPAAVAQSQCIHPPAAGLAAGDSVPLAGHRYGTHIDRRADLEYPLLGLSGLFLIRVLLFRRLLWLLLILLLLLGLLILMLVFMLLLRHGLLQPFLVQRGRLKWPAPHPMSQGQLHGFLDILLVDFGSTIEGGDCLGGSGDDYLRSVRLDSKIDAGGSD